MTLQDKLWDALKALPKPVTLESAISESKSVLPPKEAAEFFRWAELHSAYLLGRLNV